MDLDHHSQLNITWDEELNKKAVQIEQHLRSNPFYKPRPPRRSQAKHRATGGRPGPPVDQNEGMERELCILKGAESTQQKLEKELETMKLKLNKVNENVQRLENQLMSLQKESENKSMFDKAKSLEMKSLKKDCEDLENWKPSTKDEQILKDLRLRYKVLRNLTQVKFDFPNCTGDILKGFVFNSRTERLKHFIIDKSSLSQAEVIEKIIALKECIATKET